MSAGPERKELKAQWEAEVDVLEYSLKDVAKHNTKNDVWVVIHGKVYDLTNYIQDHPGGADALIEVAGEDATSAYEDVGHSEDADEIMHAYLVGVLKNASSQPKYQSNAVKVIRKTTTTEIQAKSSGSRSATQALLGVGVVGGSVYLAMQPGAASFIRNLQSRLPNVDVARFVGGDQGFVQGFLLATAACSVASAVILNQVSKASKITSGALAYPRTIKSTKIVKHQPAGFLAPRDYQKLPLVEKEYLSETAVRLVFELPTKNTVIGLPIGQHVAIKAQVGSEMVSRSYTPTSNNSDPGILELVIRIYDNGLLTGGYLSKLNVGDEVDFRGPKGAMRYRKGYAKKLGMIAGGTGITPMYQLIRAICEDDTDLTEVTLLYANRSEADILLHDRLEAFARKYPKNFKVWYMLDQPSESWKGGKGYVTKDIMAERLPSPSPDSKMLLCGPPGMVNASKSNLTALGWQAPGAVSKITDQIFCF
ncbi:hypothetical protein D6C84_10476 [Aureobasidium pullulans]|uniref:Cytochrome b5 reductase-like protein n=1 Tax=Aureobasidium pullulans TaxID=5580 RepID=A0A4S9WX74_AURPU|nr:hypothetical protein E4T51_12118 [Aureobasidium sp. EXF-12344]KAI4771198.1 hypothetical protein E4T52_13800 [Aureobasidium sp. EXF-3400]THZ70034.1 hypothetical protein D6C84_10476 [Aureobasidium pullulans]